MSILVEISYALQLGLAVDINLPSPDNNLPSPDKSISTIALGPYQQSPNRLLRFLASEGFLDCLTRLSGTGLSIVSTTGDTLSADACAAYRSLPIKPSYEDAHCVEMRVFDVPDEQDTEFARQTVENLLTGVELALSAKVAQRARDQLVVKLRLVIQEALHNAQEHAYKTKQEPRPMAIYVRYRAGGLSQSGASTDVFRANLMEEIEHCPRLLADWLEARQGCLEVFLLDRGVGFVRSLTDGGVLLKHTHKLYEAMRQTFIEGNSSKKNRHTRYGGLHLLHKYLTETGDYIRVLDDKTWFGSGTPLFRATEQAWLLAKTKLHGVAINVRLGWKAEADFRDEWISFARGEKSEIWAELQGDETSYARSFEWFKENTTVLDERFEALKVFPGGEKWILWLAKPHRMKWDIVTFVESVVVKHVFGKRTTLVIADIPSYEAAIYVSALAEFVVDPRRPWPSKFERIVLVTNRWRFAVVDYKEQANEEGRVIRHGFSPLKSDLKDVRVTTPPIEPKPENFRLAIVRWLKWHDSRRLWAAVDQRANTFMPEMVVWGKNTDGKPRTIRGYLDFPQTTHDALCAAIYRAALVRVLGVLCPNETQMIPVDRLTMSVLREVHAGEVYESPGDRIRDSVALGSILMSGSTVQAAGLPSLDLHFFVHPDSPLRGAKPALLFWLSEHMIDSSPPKLTRIGRTAAVAPGGWKSFEVPRFDLRGECVGARDPHKSYEDWQSASPVIVKAGHWSYEGHHDFITVNIANAVESAFLQQNDLARFLVNRVLPFVGLGKMDLNDAGQRLLERSVREPHGILVYRSHPSSEVIVGQLLGLLTEDARKVALSRIFPVLPIRTRWSGSTLLIPPLVREEIRSAIKERGQPRPVLLFDDASITGRTLYDLRAIINALGAEEIRTVVVANRLRRPAETFGHESLDYYWRFDLPVMGREGKCPLCYALQLAGSFASSLVAVNAKNEVAAWQRRWRQMSPLDDWSAGLQSLPLSNPKLGTRYCFRYEMPGPEDSRYLAQIDLVRSTGLAAHLAELHAMTGRDDYGLLKIAEHDEPEIRIELGASQLLLFGDEFDQDIAVELLHALIRELVRLPRNSSHASLVALTLMSSLGTLGIQAKRKAIEPVLQMDWAAGKSYVIKVLLAYLVTEGLVEPGAGAYDIGARLLKTEAMSTSSRLRAMFLETLSPKGNAHSEPIPIALDQFTEASNIMDGDIDDALDSLDRIEDLFKGCERHLVRKDASGEYDTKLLELAEATRKARSALREWLDGKTDSRSRDECKSSLEGVLHTMRALAGSVFHCIPSVVDYYSKRTFISNALMAVIDRVNWKQAFEGKEVEAGDRSIRVSSAGESSFEKGAGEVWIAWNRSHFGIVLDLLKNAVYAANLVSDPWCSEQLELANLWLRVDYGEHAVDVTLANSVNDREAPVFDKLKKKEHRWEGLTTLGGSIEPVDMGSKMFAIRIRIPYAAYLCH
jgi:hypothetical protein